MEKRFEDNLDYDPNEFFDSFRRQEYSFSKIIVMSGKIIYFILSPAILFTILFLYPYWYLCAKIDKLNG
jgi:hypothetical protein